MAALTPGEVYQLYKRFCREHRRETISSLNVYNFSEDALARLEEGPDTEVTRSFGEVTATFQKSGDTVTVGFSL